MSIQTSGEGVILVESLRGLDIGEELQNVIQQVGNQAGCHVIVDLAEVDILNSSHLASLLRLRRMLRRCEHRLILCNVRPATKGILSVTGLDAVFEIMGGRSDALSAVQAED